MQAVATFYTSDHVHWYISQSKVDHDVSPSLGLNSSIPEISLAVVSAEQLQLPEMSRLRMDVYLLQVYDKLAELVAAKVSALKVGDGSDPNTTHGPLISPAGVEKVGRSC